MKRLALAIIVMVESLPSPSVSQAPSRLNRVFYTGRVSDWVIQSATIVSGQTQQPLIDTVQCQAKKPGITVTLFRDRAASIGFSFTRSMINPALDDRTDVDIESVNIDGNQLSARYRSTDSLPRRFSNLQYSAEPPTMVFGGGYSELRRINGPWLPASSFIDTITEAKHARIAFKSDANRSGPVTIDVNLVGLKTALNQCVASLESSDALVFERSEAK